MDAAADAVVDVDEDADADVGLALSCRLAKSSSCLSLASTAERSPDAAGIPDSVSLGGPFSDPEVLVLPCSGPMVSVLTTRPVRTAVLAFLSAVNFLCLC